MSANLNTPAAIPSRAIRSARGRFISQAQAGGVGDWGWDPPGVGETIAGATLIKVRNYGTEDIKRWEACYIPDTAIQTEFFTETWLCSYANENGCGHGNDCSLGDCGTWPVTYEEVYDKALEQEPVVIKVKTTTVGIPKPDALGGWLVAAEDIAEGEYGFAYAAGIHYAMIWDPNELLGNGPEVAFVDLPEFGAGYNTNISSPTINLPLQVRPNGRGRVIAYDRLVEVTDASISTDPKWPMTNVRLALIQRANHFTYPAIPCTITGATETGVNTNRYDYDWEAKHNSSLTHELVTTALNLAESNNSASTVNGLEATDLDDCFGSSGWELQNSFDGEAEVMMSFCIDDDGLVQPYFALQNQVVPT